jgi:hypothetical protein
MVKIKASSLSIEEGVGTLPELEIKSFIIKISPNDETFSEKSIKNDYLIIMSESEYREKISAKSGRKSNPLMVTFEQY